jgi:circadian clock protein KaiC
MDAVLGGGLPANSINLVAGAPGSGKTILAQQFLFENARDDRPGIYLSTVSEPLEKILRYGQTLTFFDPAAVGSRVFYDDLGACFEEEDALGAALGRILELVRERRPGFIVIDSFKALHSYAADANAFRGFLHDLAGALSAYPATSLWVGEYATDDADLAPEFAVADGIISLVTERAGDRAIRILRVDKLRGSSPMSGNHAYRLSGNGIDVFPRLADPAVDDVYALDDQRISSGLPILDEVLHSGYWPGASTLVAGPSGSGKTLLGMHFIFGGVETGEPGLIATLQENEIQLERVAQGFGWSLETDDVHLMYRSPVDVYLDEWVYDLLARVEEHGIRRVLIDSLGDLQAVAADEVRFREWIYSLLQRTTRAGVSVFMTQEVGELFGATRLSEYGISHLSDNVVLLQYVRGRSRIHRALSVMKTRASSHDPRILGFSITSDGVEIGDPFGDDQSWD